MLEGTRGVPTPDAPRGGRGRRPRPRPARAGVEDLAAADAAAAELAAASAALAAKLEGDDGSDSDEEARNAAKVQLAEDQAAKVVADDAGPLLALKVNDAKPYMTVSKAHAGKLGVVLPTLAGGRAAASRRHTRARRFFGLDVRHARSVRGHGRGWVPGCAW